MGNGRDVANVVMDVKSLSNNIRDGNYGEAAIDAGATIFDVTTAILPIVPGGAGAILKTGRAVDKTHDLTNVVDNVLDASKVKKEKELVIKVSPENKIDRKLLNKPEKKGNVPTCKSDESSVELHHDKQDPAGSFKEMHKETHRGIGYDKVNHPNKGKPSQIDRKLFNKAKRKYWTDEFFKK